MGQPATSDQNNMAILTENTKTAAQHITGMWLLNSNKRIYN